MEAEKPRPCEVTFFFFFSCVTLHLALQNDLVFLLSSQTLSGRDIEHHFANVSIFYYSDLVNGTILRTRLGSQLLITSSQDQGQLV